MDFFDEAVGVERRGAGQQLRQLSDLSFASLDKDSAMVEQAGATTVPAHLLYDIVRKLPEGSEVMLSRRGIVWPAGARAGTFRARMPRSKSKPRPTMASQADRHALYEQAVQDPQRDVNLFSRIYRRLRGHDALRMREDFCGTAALCHAWAESMPERTAIGVDLCQVECHRAEALYGID